ncbi:MAG: very short patch repair endonuclease [Gammaproteobacteria bacterium]
MADILSKKQRSEAMSRVRSEDTKPEWILRCGLHRLGFRYRLSNPDLPGKPDLIFARYHAVVFVHGCYWHRHPGCKNASMPKSNVDFWTKKFAENVGRDRRTETQLKARGWRVMVVWECELNKNTLSSIRKVADWLKRKGDHEHDHSYELLQMSRTKLLAVAEKKVRYRLESYDKKQKSSDFEESK